PTQEGEKTRGVHRGRKARVNPDEPAAPGKAICCPRLPLSVLATAPPRRCASSGSSAAAGTELPLLLFFPTPLPILLKRPQSAGRWEGGRSQPQEASPSWPSSGPFTKKSNAFTTRTTPRSFSTCSSIQPCSTVALISSATT